MLKKEQDDFVNLSLSYHGERDSGIHSHINRPYFLMCCFSSTALPSGKRFR